MAAELRDLRAKVDVEALLLIEALAADRRIDVSTLIREILHEWALDRIRQAAVVQGALTGTVVQVPRLAIVEPELESAIRDRLFRDVRERGFTPVEREVITPLGIADLLVIGAPRGCTVIELKRELRTTHAVNRACGQVLAYAQAFGGNVCPVVAAPNLKPELAGQRIGVYVMDVEHVCDFLSSKAT